jgi:hypothetical protein
MTCASYKPRLFTSLISGQMEACIGIRIVTVLVGQLWERVLLWYVLIPLAVDKEDITSSSLNHFYTVIVSAITVLKTLSVCYGCTTSDTLRVHVYRSKYSAEQRQMYVPYPRSSCHYLVFRYVLPGVYRI